MFRKIVNLAATFGLVGSSASATAIAASIAATMSFGTVVLSPTSAFATLYMCGSGQVVCGDNKCSVAGVSGTYVKGKGMCDAKIIGTTNNGPKPAEVGTNKPIFEKDCTDGGMYGVDCSRTDNSNKQKK